MGGLGQVSVGHQGLIIRELEPFLQLLETFFLGKVLRSVCNCFEVLVLGLFPLSKT